MLNQKIFGEKLRRHRKHIGMTQEEVASKIGVSAQAISKWEAGECLPDCFNLKAIIDVYKISADVLLETESIGNIDIVSSKIEQLSTEFVWATADSNRNNGDYRRELGDDLLKMWKGIYFSEIGNAKILSESKNQGNLRVSGKYGMKVWDDEGVVCVVKSDLIRKLEINDISGAEVIKTLCTDECRLLITTLDCTMPISKEELIKTTCIEIHRLNELLLILTENKIIEFVADNRIASVTGYKLSGHCGVVAYMVLAAMYLLNKRQYNVSEYLSNQK